jgi:nucleotide-binding universal stress UspA family protein
MKNILIATDGSAPATAALNLGLDLAVDEHAKAIVVHVIPPR